MNSYQNRMSAPQPRFSPTHGFHGGYVFIHFALCLLHYAIPTHHNAHNSRFLRPMPMGGGFPVTLHGAPMGSPYGGPPMSPYLGGYGGPSPYIGGIPRPPSVYGGFGGPPDMYGGGYDHYGGGYGGGYGAGSGNQSPPMCLWAMHSQHTRNTKFLSECGRVSMPVARAMPKHTVLLHLANKDSLLRCDSGRRLRQAEYGPWRRPSNHSGPW